MSSCVGVVVNKTLNPSSPDYKWEDQGNIGIHSPDFSAGGPGWTVNAIDPAVMRGHDGKIWMLYGSFNSGGIKVTEVDSVSGIPFGTKKTVANSWTGGTSYAEGEGAAMFYNDGYYYLVYNKGGCCAGIASSYNMVVGRASTPMGPFYDKDGKNMVATNAKSGGSDFFRHDDSRGLEDRYYGPGHLGIFSENGITYLTFHYYDPSGYYPNEAANNMGGPTLGLAKLKWGEDGWPQLSMDFLDEGYYTLKNANSDKLLDLTDHAATEGNTLHQYTEDSSYDTQKWLFTPLGTGEYTIRNYSDHSMYVEATGNDNSELLNLTSNYTGAINQKFRVVQSPNGKILIYPSTKNNLFEIPYAYTTDYQVKLFVNTNHDCQRWYATPFDAPLSVSTDKSAPVNISPNPTTGIVQIKCEINSQLNLYNQIGTKILASIAYDSNTTLDISNLTAGIYILKISNENGTSIKKILKQ